MSRAQYGPRRGVGGQSNCDSGLSGTYGTGSRIGDWVLKVDATLVVRISIQVE